MKFFIYKITNLINGKIYIGKTKDVKVRWNSHKTAAKRKNKDNYSYIHRAINKYGAENFSIEVIAEYDLEADALEAEVHFIKTYNSMDRTIGYNRTEGGDGASGLKFTDEQKQNLSNAKKGKTIGPDNAFYGKHHSKDTIDRLSMLAKQRIRENKDKYNELNIKQCALTKEQCLEVQRKYLSKEYSMDKLADEYHINIASIHGILHGTYFAIKDSSIISEQDLIDINRARVKRNADLCRKFTEEQELIICDDYKNCQLLNIVALKWDTSTNLVKKILKKYKIIIKRNPSSYKKSRLSSDDIANIIKNDKSYSQLAKEYNISKSVIARIIQKSLKQQN